MFKWIHHLLNPHCSDCKLEQECKSCDTLREEVHRLIRENDRLMDIVVDRNKVQEVKEPEFHEPIRLTNYKPWRVKQQELEAAERQRAEELRRKRTTELEEEVINAPTTN